MRAMSREQFNYNMKLRQQILDQVLSGNVTLTMVSKKLGLTKCSIEHHVEVLLDGKYLDRDRAVVDNRRQWKHTVIRPVYEMPNVQFVEDRVKFKAEKHIPSPGGVIYKMSDNEYLDEKKKIKNPYILQQQEMFKEKEIARRKQGAMSSGYGVELV